MTEPRRFIMAGCAQDGCANLAAYVEEHAEYYPRTGHTEHAHRLVCYEHKDTFAEELHRAQLTVAPAPIELGDIAEPEDTRG